MTDKAALSANLAVRLTATEWAAVTGVWFIAVVVLAIFGKGTIAMVGLLILFFGGGGVIAGLLLMAKYQRATLDLDPIRQGEGPTPSAEGEGHNSRALPEPHAR